MKWWTVPALVLLSLALHCPAVIGQDRTFGTDKGMHLVGGAFSGVFFERVFDSPAHAGLAGAALWTAKELADRRQVGNHFSAKDLWWSLAGVAGGVWFSRLTAVRQGATFVLVYRRDL